MAFGGKVGYARFTPFIFHIIMVKLCIKLLVWFIVFMIVLTLGTKAMTMQNTFVAIMGLILIALFAIITVKTVFFTRIHIKITKIKKEEK